MSTVPRPTCAASLMGGPVLVPSVNTVRFGLARLPRCRSPPADAVLVLGRPQRTMACGVASGADDAGTADVDSAVPVVVLAVVAGGRAQLRGVVRGGAARIAAVRHAVEVVVLAVVALRAGQRDAGHDRGEVVVHDAADVDVGLVVLRGRARAARAAGEVGGVEPGPERHAPEVLRPLIAGCPLGAWWSRPRGGRQR